MSIFNPVSSESIDSWTKHLAKQKKEEELIGGYLQFGVQCIEVDDVVAFSEKVEEYVSPSHEAPDEILKKHQGRPVIRWDVRTFKKYDAIGSLHKLSLLPKSPKPIVIIENITEIPSGVGSIYDDPQLVENLLLHNWKNESSTFDESRFGHFEIRPSDYSVLVTWSTATSEKMKSLWRPADGLAWCGNFDRNVEQMD